MLGVVVKILDGKTVRVEVVDTFRHSLYKKVVNVKKTYLCQCDRSGIVVGDKVEITQSRKFSKKKSYIVL